jgi:flagellar basal body P-ring formation protein FlgA
MKILITILSVALFLAGGVPSSGQEASLIEKNLADMLKEAHGRPNVQVKLESIPAHLKQQVKIKSVSLHKVPDATGKGLAIVEFEGEDGRLRASYVPFRLYEKKKLFYAKKALSKGSALRLDDLGSRETVVGDSDLIYPKDAEDVVGKVVKKDVAVGTVLTNQILESPQVIRRGELVTIVGQSSQLFVRAKGKAEEPGRLGERIRVKNLSSGREVIGTVSDNRTIFVDF